MPLDAQVLEEIGQQVEEAITLHQRRRFDEAGLKFWFALAGVDGVGDARARRDKLRELASLFRKTGYEDLCLIATRQAITLDDGLADERGVVADMMLYGNVHMSLGNAGEAASVYRDILRRCLAREAYVDAASASTNLAMLTARNGDGAEALILLQNSLGYLDKAPFPQTEFITHMAIIDVVGAYGGDPALAISSGIRLKERFGERLAEARAVLAARLGQAIERFLDRNPQLDRHVWKRENFGWLDADQP